MRLNTGDDASHLFSKLNKPLAEQGVRHDVAPLFSQFGEGLFLLVFTLFADGHKMLYEKVDREFKEIHEELDELKGTQAAQEFVITRRLKQG